MRQYFRKLTNKIIFMYPPTYKNSGGTIMRGQQLSDIIKEEFKDEYSVSYESINIKPKRSVIFLTKMAIYEITLKELSVLKRRRNKILFDANDGRIDDLKLAYADIIVVASSVALREYKKRYPQIKIVLVDHHVDPRIVKSKKSKLKELRFGYFGEPANTLVTDRISKKVSIVAIDTSSQENTAWIEEMKKFNLHYAVRKMQHFDDIKPATKIFTAAYSNANVIIQDSEEEALVWLGKDYPYVIKGEATESSVLKMIKKVEDTYLGPEWERGLQSMKLIRTKLNNERVAYQFKLAIKS